MQKLLMWCNFICFILLCFKVFNKTTNHTSICMQQYFLVSMSILSMCYVLVFVLNLSWYYYLIVNTVVVGVPPINFKCFWTGIVGILWKGYKKNLRVAANYWERKIYRVLLEHPLNQHKVQKLMLLVPTACFCWSIHWFSSVSFYPIFHISWIMGCYVLKVDILEKNNRDMQKRIYCFSKGQ